MALDKLPVVRASITNVQTVVVTLSIDATLNDLKNYLEHNDAPQYALAHRLHEACTALIRQSEQEFSKVVTKE